MKCPRNKIPLRGGTLTIEGDFKLECRKDCLDFPCEDYNKYRERAGVYEE